MAPVPKVERDKILAATIEWVIGNLLLFSTLDSNLFKAMVREYAPNLAPHCAAAVCDEDLRTLECVLDLAPQPHPHTAVNTARILKRIEPLKVVVEKCHDLAKFFHSSPKMAEALDVEQQQTDPSARAVVVVMDVVTRWNSALHMMRRLLHLRVACDKLGALRPKGPDRDIVEEMVKILVLIEDMPLIFSSASKGFAASLYPRVSSVKDELTRRTSQSKAVDAFRHELKLELERRVYKAAKDCTRICDVKRSSNRH
ncbi:hypothetical protein BGZ58_009498 [Dissophora ornata]|nr:hypothetical protein BGZ58_009498 [Dissophora ornata]